MSNTRSFHPSAMRTGSWAPWVQWLACTLVLATILPAFADEEEEQYLSVVETIQKADALDSTGQIGKALTKYQEAQTALEAFRKAHPDWNLNVIAYRKNYLAQKIAFCSEKISKAAAATGKPSENKPGTNSENQTSGKASGFTIKLLEPGSEPRQALRLHPKEGEKQTLIMTLKIATAMKTGEVESPSMKLPAMIMAMEVTVKSVSPEGDIASELVITDASVADQPGILPQMAEAMKVSLGNLKGLSANGVTSNSGVNKSTEINAPSGADSQVRNAMEQMKDSFASFSSPLPDEAVGAGAKWEVRLPLKSQGMTIDQTTTYELVSLKDELVSIHFTSNETAPPQKIEDLAMPGVKLDLVKLSGRGSGEVNVNLSQLLPTTGSITSHTDLLVNVGAGARQQSMGKTTDIDLHLEAK